jgi:hypothetical protein
MADLPRQYPARLDRAAPDHAATAAPSSRLRRAPRNGANALILQEKNSVFAKRRKD